MSSDVFISYGSSDRSIAGDLAGLLEKAGLEVWWDRRIEPGKDFAEAIEQAITESSAVVVLWSHQSVSSDWVKAEAMDGLDRKILIPVVLDDVRVPFAFRALNTVRLHNWPGYEPDEFRRLMERISTLLDPDKAPATPSEKSENVDQQIPSVAVMPLMLTTGDPEDEMLSAGVISSLSKLPGFFVIAFSTMWGFRESGMEARKVAQELGVRYVVQGTILKAGSQLQVMVELVDATSNKQLWSESIRATQTVEDLFALQGQISRSIAGRLQPRLMVAETQRSLSRQPETLQAWELVNRCRRPYAGRNEDVIGHLKRAIEIDPNYSEAHAMLAMALSFRATLLGPQHAIEARAAIDRAIEIDPDHDLTLMAAGVSCVNLAQYDEALVYSERAVDLNPNFAQAWAYLGLSRLGAQKGGDLALEAIDYAFDLSPNDEMSYVWYHMKAPCYAELGEFEKAAEMSGRSTQLYRGWFFSWLCHAQYLAVVERTDEAVKAWGEAKSRFSALSMEMYRAAVLNFSPTSQEKSQVILAAVERLGVE